MATDAAGHTIPNGYPDHPARSDLLKLSLSIRDAIRIANTAGRATQLAQLAASLPAVVPSASTPVLFYQQDLPAAYRYIYTVDGLNFISLSGAFVWPNSTARTNATTMAAGSKGYQVDTRITYRHDGATWKPWESEWAALTPTITATTGTFTTVSCAFRYKWMAGVYAYSYAITMTALGTAAAFISLPLGVTASQHSIGTAYGNSVGLTGVTGIAAGESTALIRRYDNNTLITGNGHVVQGFGFVEV